jgi:glycosidase
MTLAKARIINYNCNSSFIVLATVTMNVNYGRKTFIVHATGVPFQLRSYLKSYIDGVPSWAWPNFQLGNHDNGRVASRFGPELVDAMNMVYMLLPGTPITYYGEELGMVDGVLESPNDKRDPERTPMQWSEEAHAGNFHPHSSLAFKTI